MRLEKKLNDTQFNNLQKHINKELNLAVSQELYVGAGQTGIYANKKWIDIKGNRVILYYFETGYNPDVEKLKDLIKVKGMAFKIEYWKEQRPVIATSLEQREMYERVRETRKEKKENYSG